MPTKKIAKIFGIIILAAVIAAVLVFERYIVQRSQYEIPVLSDYGIFYGDTPAEVSRKLGTKAAAKERLPYVPETYISYNVATLDSDAEITCYFIYGHIWPVSYRSGYLYHGGKRGAGGRAVHSSRGTNRRRIRRAALFHSRRSPAQGRRFLQSVILLELRCNRDRLYAQGTGKQPEHKLLQAVLMKS